MDCLRFRHVTSAKKCSRSKYLAGVLSNWLCMLLTETSSYGIRSNIKRNKLYCVSTHTYPEPTFTFTQLVYCSAFYGCRKDELCTLKNKVFVHRQEKLFFSNIWDLGNSMCTFGCQQKIKKQKELRISCASSLIYLLRWCIWWQMTIREDVPEPWFLTVGCDIVWAQWDSAVVFCLIIQIP